MKYGLIGGKLTHSFSKTIHEQLGNNDYELLEISEENFHDYMIKRDFYAINVTIPYKEKIIPYLDDNISYTTIATILSITTHILLIIAGSCLPLISNEVLV